MGIVRAQKPITEQQLPPGATLDAEYIAADVAHAGMPDPHFQYLNASRGDSRYQILLPVSIVQQQVGPPGQISIIANSWFDLGIFNNVNSGISESLFAMSLYVQYIVSGTTNPYWQYSGSCLISPVWWRAGGAQLVKYIDMEGHNTTDFTLSFRLGTTQSNRMVQLYFPVSLSARLIRATFIRLF